MKDNLGSNVLSASGLFDETFLQVSVEGHPRKAFGQQIVLHNLHFFDICREISIICIFQHLQRNFEMASAMAAASGLSEEVLERLAGDPLSCVERVAR